MWLLIAITSLGVFIYLLITEGFIDGKAWVYLITLAIAALMYYLRRRQRLAREMDK
ncbi:MAG TPA: hypothetical protein VEC12_13395 [Bacteroidia bacterium]|nr:hypothetical protein [Bacteroidia bacterium]